MNELLNILENDDNDISTHEIFIEPLEVNELIYEDSNKEEDN